MKIFLAHMTFKLAGIVTMLQIGEKILLPKLSLLLWVCILMALDLITGLLKAKLRKEAITSEKMRRTIIKFLQYFGCLGIVIVLINQNHESKTFVEVMDWAKDGLSILIIYIECLSIFENLYDMDKKTPISIYVIQPIYFLLSLAVRNNPAKRAEEEAKQKEKDKTDPA